MSEYDPIGEPFEGLADDDLEAVRERFEEASRPYLSSPWSWLAWALILPAAALATPRAAAAGGGRAVLLVWSVAVLVGGVVEITQIWRGRRHGFASPLASWVLRRQGNMSLAAVALSAALLWQDAAWMLPGLWLLLLGHSLYSVGGLAFQPLVACGLLYQLGGIVALWPHGRSLEVFAAATSLGGAWVAWSIARREDPQP